MLKPHLSVLLLTAKQWPHHVESESHSVMSDSLRPHGLYSLWNSLDQNTGVGSLFLLQGSSQPREWTQVSRNTGEFLYLLSHKRSPRILEWVAYPFSSGPSWPRNQIGVSCIAGRFFQFSSVQFSRSVIADSLQSHGLQHARPPCPSPAPRVHSNSYPLSQRCHPTISVVPFSSRLQSFPASGSFQMSQFFASGGQGVGVSASASVLPVNIQDWSPLGWAGGISLQSKGLSRVLSNYQGSLHHVRRRQVNDSVVTSLFFNLVKFSQNVHLWYLFMHLHRQPECLHPWCFWYKLLELCALKAA